MDISVGGLLFERFPNGLQGFLITELSESVGTRGETIDRPAAHGDFDLPVYRGARFLTITGAAFASSVWGLEKMEQDFMGVLSDGSAGELVQQHADGSRLCRVRLSGEPKFTRVGERDADFQIAFRAADPRKYGELQSFSGSSVSVFHRGNFPASPVVEIAGPRTGPYTISGPGGRVVTVAQSLTSGQTHRIDFGTGRLTRNGAAQLGQMTHFRPWTIPPHRDTVMSISGGSMTVQVKDTFM